MARIIKCDRCGLTITYLSLPTPNDDRWGYKIKKVVDPDLPDDDGYIDFDLCDTCRKSLYYWIKRL